MQRNKKAKNGKYSWGGPRDNQTGRPTKPAADKLIYKRVGLTPAEWRRVHDLAKREKISGNAALRRILNSPPSKRRRGS